MTQRRRDAEYAEAEKHMKMMAGWVVLAIVSLPVLAQSPADDAAIRGIVKSYIDARDRDDAKGVETLFTSDADQLVSSGEWRRGREEVVKGTLASTRSGGKRTIAIETIRHIAPGVAIADGRYELVGDAQTRRMWTTFVLTRISGTWKIAAIRNMLPAAAAASAPAAPGKQATFSRGLSYRVQRCLWRTFV